MKPALDPSSACHRDAVSFVRGAGGDGDDAVMATVATKGQASNQLAPLYCWGGGNEAWDVGWSFGL